MKHREKLYFPDWDDEQCAIIQYLKEEAKREGISEFEAYEAVYDPLQKWYCYCKKEGECTERKYCTKSACDGYEPNKSGRGVCKYRGYCYEKGTKKIHIKVD